MGDDDFSGTGVDMDTPDWVLQNPLGAEEPYGPPNPFEASADQPGAYGPPNPFEASADQPGAYGPPNPFEASPDQPGAYGPPSSLAPDAHVDVDPKEPAGSKAFDYGSLFTSVAKVTGEVVKASVGTGLPGPVAAATAAATAAQQEAARQPQAAQPQAATQPVPIAQSSAAAPTSTAAIVALGLGGFALTSLVALAATRKRRR